MDIEKDILPNMPSWNWLKAGKNTRQNGYSAAVLMDLSKAFDTTNHDLLIAKLYAYSIRGSTLKLNIISVIDFQRTTRHVYIGQREVKFIAST